MGKRYPTIRQKVAFDKTLEDIGKKRPVKMGKVMIDSGYKKTTALNPQKNLLSKKGWQELWKKNFPAERIQNLINKLVKEYEEAPKIQDKNALLGLIHYLTKVSDNYPEKRLRISQYEGELKDLTDK